MASWTLSELGCKGNCNQGRDPCDCKNTITVKDGEATFSYTPPCVIVNNGASLIPVPFAGWINENP